MSKEMSDRAKCFLSLVDQHVFTVDDGVLMNSSKIDRHFNDDTIGEDVALTVTWTDDEGLIFEEEFTYNAIEEAQTDGEKINIKNTQGEIAQFRFFTLEKVNVPANDFLPIKAHAPSQR